MNSRLSTCLVALTSALVVGWSSAADANTLNQFYHPTSCQVVQGTVQFNAFGQIENNTTGTVKLWCPLISDPESPLATSLGGLVVGFSNGCSGLTVQLLRVPAAGGAAVPSDVPDESSCSPGVEGVVGFGPPPASVGPNDYAFLLVTLGPKVGTSMNTLLQYQNMQP
jgi:hypothetical protein